MKRHPSIRKRQGAIIIITFIFMVAVGLTTLITLSMLGSATLAQARLTQASQAAAYASVQEFTSREANEAQVSISCDDAGFSSSDPNEVPVCRSGNAVGAAEAVLRANLNCKAGLLYPGAPNQGVTLASGESECGAPNVSLSGGGIEVYNLSHAAGFNQEVDDRLGSGGCEAGQYSTLVSLVPTRICWREESANVSGANAPPHYTSGVIVRTQATLRVGFLGSCRGVAIPFNPQLRTSLICRTLTIRGSGVAAYAQQSELTENEQQDISSYDPGH